jgi:hypothetical protein
MYLNRHLRDEFGLIKFNVNGILESIPRSRSSEYKHIELKSMTLNNTQNNVYSVHPNTNIKAVSRKEADKIIRKHIWNNFFGLSSNYRYSDAFHHPTTFAIYLKAKLGIDVTASGSITSARVDSFILQVRNVIFTRVLYLFKPYFVEITNKLIDERPITIYNDPVFEIKQQWKHWLP